MKIIDVKQGSDLWLEFRRGKITGTSLGQLWQARQYTKNDIVLLLESKKLEFKKSAKKDDLELLLTDEDKAVLASQADKKLEFYQVIADQLATLPDDEWRMDRGIRLEDVAAERFAKDYNKKLEVVGCCVSDADPRIINSPDRLITPSSKDATIVNEKYTEALEIKCLSSARHLQAIIENVVPDEFFTQKVQYFVVNEHLETLYFAFYDERFKYKNLQLHVIKVTREDVGDWPKIMLNYQLNQLKEMDIIIERLAF